MPDAVIDLRYATPDNFVGVPMYPAGARCLVDESMAGGLAAAADALRPGGDVLVFWDCYRPHDVQVRMFEAVSDPGWVARPGPYARSHEAGLSVDVTLARGGSPVDMGTGFDEFTPRANAYATDGVSASAQANRARLRDAMAAGGLTVYSGEWWHFDVPRVRQASDSRCAGELGDLIARCFCRLAYARDKSTVYVASDVRRPQLPLRCEPNPNRVSAGYPRPQTVAAQCHIEESGQHRELQRLARRPLRCLGRTDNTGADDSRLFRAAPARRVLGCRRPVADRTSGLRRPSPCSVIAGPTLSQRSLGGAGVATVCHRPSWHTSGIIALGMVIASA